jgi:outer membrane lipoprotein-sorting protein
MRYGRTKTTESAGAQGPRLGRRARWAVPAGAVVAVAAVVAGTTVAGAQTAPSLPSRTAAQLIADVQRTSGPGPMTATIQLTANLGLPDLPGASDSSSALSLLSGTHTANIWYADPGHVRIAEPVQLGESDLRRDGQQVWLWDSRTQTATHVVLPAAERHGRARMPGTPRPPGTIPTPQQVARQILAAIGPTTTVSVQNNVEVAGQAAYQISLAPKDSRSLVGQVRIAIDASKSFPLRLQVFARGATSPAFELGFTALSFGRPAASNFSFTPPAGAKVKNVRLPALPPRHGMLFGRPVPGKAMFLRPADGKRVIIKAGRAVKLLPVQGMPGKVVIGKAANGQRAVIVRPGRVVIGKAANGQRAVIVRPGRVVIGKAANGQREIIVRLAPAGKGPQRNTDWQLKPATRAPSGSLFAKPGMGLWSGLAPGMGGPLAGPLLGRPQVMGKGWLSVLVITPGAQARAAAVSPPCSGQRGGGNQAYSSTATLSQTADSPGADSPGAGSPGAGSPGAGSSPGTGVSGPVPGVLAGGGPAILRALLRAATPVHGTWGSGRLLRTSLVSVLITNNGTVLAGAVTPSVLYADAAQVK